MKTKVVVCILMLLFSAAVGPLLIDFAVANPPIWPVGSFKIKIFSPKNDWTYKIPMEVSFQYFAPLQQSFTRCVFSFSLDGQKISLNLTEANGSYHAPLPLLPNGEHILTISMTLLYGKTPYVGYSGVTFTVDYTAPTVTVLPLENATCTGDDAAFGFRVIDASLSWVGYSLDGNENVTVSSEALAQTAFGLRKAWSGNLSFTGLSNGLHSLTVYAGNEVGYTGASETLFFKVAQPREAGSQLSGSESSPTTLVIVASSVSLAAAVSVCVLLFFFKKGKKP